MAIRISGINKWLSKNPVKEELEKLSNKELFIIALRHQIGLKKLLIDFILTKKEI